MEFSMRSKGGECLGKTLQTMVLALFAIALPSCEPPPNNLQSNAWYVVQSDSEPGAIEKDGVRWMPVKSQEENQWIFCPQGLLMEMERAKSNSPGTVLTVIVDGRKWTLNRTEDRCQITAPWETESRFWYFLGPQQKEEDALGVGRVVGLFFLIVITVVVLVFLIRLVVNSVPTTEEQKTAIETKSLAAVDNNENARKADAARQKQDDRIREEARREHEKANQELAIRHNQEIEKVRREEQERSLAAQERLAKLAASIETGDDVEAIDGMMRKLIMRGGSRGRIVTVKYLASPTGRVALEWVVHGPITRDAKITLKLDGEILLTDCQLEGRYAYQLKDLGNRYMFGVDIECTEHNVENDALFAVRIPTEEEWARTPASGGDTKIAKEFKEFSKERDSLRKLQEEAHRQLNESNLDEEGKERWHADIDAFVLKIQERLET